MDPRPLVVDDRLVGDHNPTALEWYGIGPAIQEGDDAGEAECYVAYASPRYAKLMAAAPDLLAAIEEFVSDINRVSLAYASEDWPDLVVTYRHAIAAIAKAKGGADVPAE